MPKLDFLWRLYRMNLCRFQVVNFDRSDMVNFNRSEVVSLNRSRVVSFTGFCNEINDSLRTGQVTMLPLESMPSLNFDSILENTFNPFVAKNFNDSLLRATRFIAWHAISQDFFGSDNSAQTD